MWLRLLFLTSLSLVSCAPASAEQSTELSGYAFGTYFGDNHWNKDRSVVAVNLDHMNDYVNVRAQFATYDYSALRRLSISKDFHIGSGGYLTAQVGRLSRVDSFFNNVLDTPAASGMALLPLAGYNYRMFQGSFSMVDGWKLSASQHFGEHLFTGHWTHGYMVVTDQMNYQQEVLKKQVNGIYLSSMIGDTWEGHWETGNWHSYISRTFYGATTKQTSVNTTSTYYATNAAVALYDLNKYGIKYDGEKYWMMLEYSAGFSHTYGGTGKRTSITDAFDHSATFGYYFGDLYSAYIGSSFGKNLTAKTESWDSYIGLTKKWDRFTLSGAYHEGKGQGWMQYDAVAPYDWKSTVVSGTYQF